MPVLAIVRGPLPYPVGPEGQPAKPAGPTPIAAERALLVMTDPW